MTTISVVCCGQEIRGYLREAHIPGKWRLLPPEGQGRQRLEYEAKLQGADWPVHRDAIQLRCRECGYNEQRRLDGTYGQDFPPFSEVFERLAEQGLSEISAKNLVSLVWG